MWSVCIRTTIAAVTGLQSAAVFHNTGNVHIEVLMMSV